VGLGKVLRRVQRKKISWSGRLIGEETSPGVASKENMLLGGGGGLYPREG